MIASSPTLAPGGLVGRGSTIGQVCALFALTPRAIRFYEERGLIAPARDGQNRRVYDRALRKRLKTIAELRRAGLPIWEIRALLEAGGADEAVLRAQALEKLKDRLVELDRAREDLVDLISALETRRPWELPAERT